MSNSNLFNNRERNEENLIEVKMYETYDGKKFGDLEVTVDEDGVIVLDGKATGNVDIDLGEIYVGTNQPTYYYISGSYGGSSETYYLCFETEGGSQAVNMQSICADGAQCVFVVPESGYTVSLSLIVKEGTELNNVKFYPVIVTDAAELTYFE